MFSEAYKELCINNADRLREEWEKRTIKVGDYAMRSGGRGADDLPHIVIGLMGGQYHYMYLDPKDWEKTNNLKWRFGEWPPKGTVMYPFRDCIPLFQPRQIIEMLEERGYNIEQSIYTDNSTSITAYQKCVAFWHGDDTWHCWGCGSYVRYTAKGCIQVGWHDREGQPCPHLVEAEGPDPATALLKAYLEVVSHRGKEE